MSEEEKKAINDLVFIIVTDIYDNEVSIDKPKIINEYNKSVGIVLNLIKKQSKEIEHQREKRENQRKELAILNEKQKEFNKLVNTVNSYKGQFKRQQKEIEEYEKQLDLDYAENKIKEAYIKGTNVADELCNKKWEDKIKAKIEELKKIKKKLEEESSDYPIKEEWIQANIGIMFLQEHLEKE